MVTVVYTKADDKELRKALASLSPAGRARWRKWLAARQEAHDQPVRGIPYYLERNRNGVLELPKVR